MYKGFLSSIDFKLKQLPSRGFFSIFYSPFVLFTYTINGDMSDYDNGYPVESTPLSLGYIIFLAVIIVGFLYYLHSKNKSAEQEIKDKELNSKLDEITANIQKLSGSKEVDDNRASDKTKKEINLKSIVPKAPDSKPTIHQIYKSKLLSELKLDPYEVLGVPKNIGLMELLEIDRQNLKALIRNSPKTPYSYNKEALDKYRRQREAYYVLRSERDLAFNPRIGQE